MNVCQNKGSISYRVNLSDILAAGTMRSRRVRRRRGGFAAGCGKAEGGGASTERPEVCRRHTDRL